MKLSYVMYFGPLVLIWLAYLRRSQVTSQVSLAALEQARASGLTEPASLHPRVDPLKCIGCASCVAACPEQPVHRVLGLINGKAELVQPTDCIGHGACKTACPVDAISLVFGTERRGVDIPHVQPNFETNVPGIFIAGELGGMGLIRNAINQGQQAMQSVAAHPGVGSGTMLDVLIVGAGPAGIAASLAAMERKLRFVTLEQDSLGGTVAQFPRGKLVMTAPAHLPLYGKMQFTNTSKESLLNFWQGVEADTGMKIHYQERVESVVRDTDGLRISTNSDSFRAHTVLLAVGRRGTPRKLGVPGEELPKVVYRLIDAEQYRGQHVLVVGGGDSALEAALAIAKEPGTCVTTSYRSSAFSRAKPRNRDAVLQMSEAGKLRLLMESTVQSITRPEVTLMQGGKEVVVQNDAVIVCVGGILPTAFLKSAGIEVETRYGTA